MQTLSVTPVIGLPKFDGWSQVVTNQRQSFICSFSVFGDNAGNVGRDVVDLISSEEPNSVSSLYQLISKVITSVEDKDCRLQISCGLFESFDSFLATYNGSVWLKRNQKVGQILKSEQELKVVQGKAVTNDNFIFVTSQCENLWGEIYQKLSQGYDIDTIITSIVPGLHSQNDSSLSALAFVNIRQPEKDDLESLVESDEQDNQPTSSFVLNNLTNGDTDPVNNSPFPRKKINYKQLFNKLFSKIKQLADLIGKKKLIKSPNQLNLSKKQKIKVLFFTGLFFLILILGSVWSFQTKQQQKQAQAIADSFSDRIPQAQALLSSDPVTARQLVTQLIEDLKQAETTFANKKAGLKIIQKEKVKALEYYDQISGQQEVDQLPLFFDLRLVKPEIIASDVHLIGEEGLFLDPEIHQMVKLNLTTKQSFLIALPQEANIVDLATGLDHFFLLSDVIFQGTVQSDQIKKVVDNSDRLTKAKFVDFFDGNLYVLNPEQRNIFRYKPSDSEDKLFADPQAWLKTFQGVDFAQVNSMTIDGDIWLGTKTGQIFRLRSGRLESYEIKGLPASFDSSLVVSTNADSDKLVVLEASKQRIVILNKNGNFEKEIKSSSLSSATDLVLSNDSQQVLVVSGSLVYKLDLASN